MTRETRNRLTILGAGILAICVFGGLSVRHNIPAIEQDLTDRAERELRKSRMSWATVQLSGRELTLSGVAPDAEARDAAIRTAAVWGVRTVASELDTVVEFVSEDVTAESNRERAVSTRSARVPAAQVESFRTRMTVDDDRLILDGAVPGERQRREFVELAQSRFSVAAVEARLQPRERAPEQWFQAAALGLEIAYLLVFGEVNLVDRSLHVMGVTATRDGDERIRQLLAEQLPQGYSGTSETGVRAELDAVLRTSPELAQRLARSKRPGPPAELPAPRVLDDLDCKAEFRNALGDRRILYATASAALTPDSRILLDELAAVLKRCSGLRISIHGHTDDQGRMEDNLALSQQRAESVMQHFVSRGISLGRMSAQGFGEERPLVPNDTAADRATNRRIEFIFDNG